MSNIKVKLLSNTYIENRIQLTCDKIEPSTLSTEYEPNSIIPADNWRGLTEVELISLFSKTRFAYNNTIAILKPDQEVESLLNCLMIILNNCNDEQSLNQAITSEYVLTIRKRLCVLIDSQYSLKVNFANEEFNNDIGNISINDPFLTTVTINPNTSLPLGLHVDDWSKMPLNLRSTASNRICFNLGTSCRHLLFIDLEIIELYEALKKHGLENFLDPHNFKIIHEHSPEKIGATNIGRMFAREIFNYPIMRIKVDPGEAYIAPTENMVHDGSSIDCKKFDINLTLRGYYSIV